MLKSILVGFGSAFLLCAMALAQDVKPPLFAVKSDHGAVIYHNEPGNKFAFEIPGKEIKGGLTPMNTFRFAVDGQIINIRFAKVEDISGAKKTTNPVEILQAHQKWETDFQSKISGGNLPLEAGGIEVVTVQSSEKLAANFWVITSPEADKSGNDRQCFLATVVGNKILVLSAPLKQNEDKQILHSYLTGILKSLEFAKEEPKKTMLALPARTTKKKNVRQQK